MTVAESVETQPLSLPEELRPPFARPMIFLAGPETNRWTHRNGRMYLSAELLQRL